MLFLRSSCTLLAVTLVAGQLFGGGDDDPTKEALQEIQSYVGSWKGSGSSEKDKTAIWKETANWGWRFKGKEVFFAADMPDSKFFKKGELRYIPAKMIFQLAVTDLKDKKLLFEGKLKKNKLTLERLDEGTKETHQVTINTAGDGDRLIVRFLVKPENRTLFNLTNGIDYTREGVTFAAAGNKKAECVVTGGLGTMTVSFKGTTYYVCCSGCRDAFNENPEKIIKEYLAKKKAGQ